MELDLNATSRGSPTVTSYAHHAALNAANDVLFNDANKKQSFQELRNASASLVTVAPGGLTAEGERTRKMYAYDAIGYYYQDFMNHTQSQLYPKFLPVISAGYYQQAGQPMTPGFLLPLVKRIGDNKEFERKVKETIRQLYLNGRATMLETCVASMIATHMRDR